MNPHFANGLSRRVATLGKIVFFSSFLLASTLSVARAAEPERFKVDFDAAGSPILIMDGNVISKPIPDYRTSVRLRPVDYKVPVYGMSPKDFPFRSEFPATSVFDRAARRLTMTYTWGEVVRTYTPVANGVDVSVAIKNTTDQVLYEFEQDGIALKLPKDSDPARTTEAVYFGNDALALSGDTLAGPVALPMLIGDRALVATTPDIKQLELRWQSQTWTVPWLRKEPPRSNDPVAQELADRARRDEIERGDSWILGVFIGGEQVLFHDRHTSRPIPPGGADVVKFALRVGDAAQPLAPAKEFLQTYAKAHPMKFKWPDRRPITGVFVGDGFPFHGPEGPTFTVPKVTASADFRKNLLESADAQIARMKEVNAQGMIVWNIESNGTDDIKYVGDPKMIKYMCPEADAVADEYFKKFRDAGFKVGVCLRPSEIVIQEASPGKYIYAHNYPHAVIKPEDVLSAKVEYAKKRWGCTLFYVDTNIASGFFPQNDAERAAWPKNGDGSYYSYSALLNEDVWAAVLKKHPDVLFVIEHTPLIQYTINAPFDGWQNPAGPTPPVVKATWPEAFKTLVISQPAAFWKTVDAVKQGDVLFGQGEFVQSVLLVSDYLKTAPPADVTALPKEKLPAVVLDEAAPRRSRFFALRRLTKHGLDAETAAKILNGKDSILQMLALDALKTPEEVSAQVPQLIRLMAQSGHYGFLALPIRDAILRTGEEGVKSLVQRVRANPDEGPGVVTILNEVPSPLGTDGKTALVADAEVSASNRRLAAIELAWQPEAGPKSATIALDYLLPLLQSADERLVVAGSLQTWYINAGLWHRNPRVYDAAVAAAADERAKPQPDQAFLALLDKIIVAGK